MYERSGLAICSADLKHLFRSAVVNEIGKKVVGKRRHRQKFAKDNVRKILSYDINKHERVRKIQRQKITFLSCFAFPSKLKAGDIVPTGQYMKNQTFSNLRFTSDRSWNVLFSVFILTREKQALNSYLLYMLISPEFALMFTKASFFHLKGKGRHKKVASRPVENRFYWVMDRRCGRGFSALVQIIGRTAIRILRKWSLVPATNRVDFYVLDFAAPEIADNDSDWKIFQTTAKSKAGQTLGKLSSSGSR